MSAYVCTYHHPRIDPQSTEWQRTLEDAEGNHLLQTFLDRYDRNFWDWGDDPSFFAAEHMLGDVGRASWGVCRRDVRNALHEGSLVIFFCGRDDGFNWHYYFVGFGTVGALVERTALWTNPAYKEYRRFYNVLARLEGGALVQCETFHNYHPNWRHRAEAPYVIFDSEQSRFNLQDPHCVATWTRGAPPREVWGTDARSRELEQLLFIERGIDRRLRTSSQGFCHSKLNILCGHAGLRPGRAVPELLGALSRLA